MTACAAPSSRSRRPRRGCRRAFRSASRSRAAGTPERSCGGNRLPSGSLGLGLRQGNGAGTLKTILVRSVRRGELLAAKALALFTYIAIALLVFAATGIVAGVAAWGSHPLANISGQRISAAHALRLTLAAIAVYIVPTIAIASFGLFLSVVTRQSVTAVVGTIFYALALEGLTRATPPGIRREDGPKSWRIASPLLCAPVAGEELVGDACPLIVRCGR